MAGRRVLIIGSQCDDLGRLSFLPTVAERLHELMINGPGECSGVVLEGCPDGLLLDPTVAEAKAAIESAVREAAGAGVALILAYVGHGDLYRGRFYLRTKDSTGPTPATAVDLARFLSDQLLNYPDVRGLTVLLDACHAGEGVKEAMADWAKSVKVDHAFELLAETDDRETAEAPLFHALIRLLERGAREPEAGLRLKCRDLHRRLKADFRPAQIVEFGPGLDLGRNPARDPGDVFWNGEGSQDRDLILQRTGHFQPTEDLRRLVAAAQAEPVVVLKAPAGAGKSTLASALVRPELTEGIVPAGFVQAIAMLAEQRGDTDLGPGLEAQLKRTVPGFAEGARAFQTIMGQEALKPLDLIHRRVLGPLLHLPEPSTVRIVLDGFNQLNEPTRVLLTKLIAERPAHLHFILTCHPDSDVPPGASVEIRPTEAATLDAYLKDRGLSSRAWGTIAAKSAGNWLIASLLADAVTVNPDVDLAGLPGTVAGAYRLRLSQVTGRSYEAWRTRFAPILAPLAVAGLGPALPLPLLVHASRSLGSPEDEPAVRDVLTALGGLALRSDLGSTVDHAGLFHATLADYLLSPVAAEHGFELEETPAHRAVLAAIASLAPRTERLVDDPLHRYAFHREPHHWWAIGDLDEFWQSLRSREAPIPRMNLDRWQSWESTLQERWNQGDHPLVLWFRSGLAFWRGQCGDAQGALAAFKALRLDMERVLDLGHPKVLEIRNNIAYWMGKCGDVRGELRELEALLPDAERELGRDHRHVLTLRNNIASRRGACGNPREALLELEAILRDQREWGMDPDHPDVLRTLNNIAYWKGICGDIRGALLESENLLQDRARVMGRDHSEVLITRSNAARWRGESGDANGAVSQFEALLSDMERVLGRDHPDTLDTMAFLGLNLINAGRPLDGCLRLREGLARAEQRFGPEHGLVETFRNAIVHQGCDWA